MDHWTELTRALSNLIALASAGITLATTIVNGRRRPPRDPDESERDR
jgi:hypothetical protein